MKGSLDTEKTLLVAYVSAASFQFWIAHLR